MVNRLSKLLLAAFALIAVLGTAAPASAHWGPHYGVSLYYGAYPYPGYYPYYYTPPPPVVYAPPPTVVYTQPQTTIVQTVPAPASVVATQTSPTFTGANGEPCRQYQSGSTVGTACEQPDGTWRTVQ